MLIEIFKNTKKVSNKIIHNNSVRKLVLGSSFLFRRQKRPNRWRENLKAFLTSITNLKDNIDYFTGKLIK